MGYIEIYLIGCLCSFSLVVVSIPGSTAHRWVHPARNTHDVIAQNYAQFHRRNSYAVSLRDPNNRKVHIQENDHYRIFDTQNPHSAATDLHPAGRVRVTIHNGYRQPPRSTVPRDEASSSPHNYHHQHHHRRRRQHHSNHHPHDNRGENRPASHHDDNRSVKNHRDVNEPGRENPDRRHEYRPPPYHDDNRSEKDNRDRRHESRPSIRDENRSSKDHSNNRHPYHDDNSSRKDHRDSRHENRPPMAPPAPLSPPRKCEPIPYNCLMQKHLHDNRVPVQNRPDCKIEKTWKALGCPQIINDLLARGKKLCHKKPFFLLLLPKSGNGYPTHSTPSDRRTHPTTARPYWTERRTHPPRPTEAKTYPTTPRSYWTRPTTQSTTPRTQPTRPTYPRTQPTRPVDPRTRPATPRPYDYRTRSNDPRTRPTTQRPYWEDPRYRPSTSRPRTRPTESPTSATRPYWEDPRYRPSTPRPYWEDNWTPYRPNRPSYQPVRPTESVLPVETRPRPSPTPETTTVATTTTTKATTTTTTTTIKPFTFCPAPERPKNGLVVCYDDQIVAVENSVLPGGNEKRVVYPTGTVCKYFCSSGYELSTNDPNEGVIVCVDTTWNQTSTVHCLYNYCPKSPDIENAVMSCIDKKSDPGAPRRSDVSVEESYSSNGLYRSDTSVCTYKCKSGYQMVIPDKRGALTKSNFVRSWTIACKPPKWNITEAIPKCLKKMEPVLNCQDAITKVKGRWKTDLFDTPTATSGDQSGRRLKVSCTSKVKGQKLGLRVVTCNAQDPFYGTSAFCKFKVNVIGQCLEPPVAPVNGSITCDLSEDNGPSVGPILHSVGSFCHYSCDSGHVIPTSQSQLDTITCSEGLKWNLTKAPLCVQQLPPTAKVCDNVPQNSTDPELFVAPDYFSAFNNKKLNSSCVVTNETGDVVATFKDQTKLSLLGLFVITCSAYDPELRISAECNYSMKAVDVDVPLDELTTLSSEDSLTEAPYDGRDLIKLSEECPVLMSPANGDIECDMEANNCVVTCEKDHTLHSSAFRGKSKSTLTVECIRDEERWSFMPTKDSPAKLPDCLRELPTTSLEVVLGFNVSLKNGCGSNEPFINRTVQVLVAANRGSCATINCKDWITQCWQNERGSTLTFKWIVKASFDPKDYDSNAEDMIDYVIKQTKKTVNSGDDFRKMVEAEGHSIVDNSFTQSHFRLVCDKLGFGVDKATDQCVECPSGTYHDGGEECVPCEFGTYQDGTGATECKPCTSTSSTPGSSGARTKSEC